MRRPFRTHLLSAATLLALAPANLQAQADDDLPRLPNPVIVAEKLAGQLVRLDPETGELVAHALDPETAIDHFLFYYSAGWNPTCKKFTPALVKFYNEQKAAGGNFEIVFVSVDDSDAEMKAYMASAKMPWPALRHRKAVFAPEGETLPFEVPDGQEPLEERLDFLKQAAGRGVPCVVVMDSRGLILAHSYKRRKEYLGPEKPLEEFSKMLATAAEKRAAKEAGAAPEGEGE